MTSTAEDRARRLAGRRWSISIGGTPAPVSTGRTFAVTSPVDGSVVAHVPDAGPGDVVRAVDVAELATSDARRRPIRERVRMLLDLADAIEERAEDLAILDVLDCGAPITKMRDDVAVTLERMRHLAGIAPDVRGDTIPVGTGLHYTEYEPFGVVARITPFNHPFMFAATKLIAPLLMGNTVVLKPAEATPLSALLLGEIVGDALPRGLVSVVVGDGPEVPRALVRDERVRRIGFTGSELTGRAIQRDAADTGVKDVTLELGGKNALIAFPDVAPDDIARAAVRGMNFTWSGQSCGSTSRLLVHTSQRDAVLDELRTLTAAIRLGSPFEETTEMGAIVSERQYDRVREYIGIGLDEGATLVAGGGRPDWASGGYYVQPTVFADVDPASRLGQEEVFGPVLSVMTWEDEDEAVRIANSVRYGLTGSVWTNDVRRAHSVARRLDAGFVWINGVSQHFTGVPFGGVKASGIGREESLEELLSYGRLKATNVMLPGL